MVVVTDLEYHLETKLVKKMDLMIHRVTKRNKDVVLPVEGAEGEGKTNSSIAIAYYFKYKTGRPIHMFFRLRSLIKFAQNTKEQIIIWDEPALDSLSTDWFREVNKDLMRLLMTCRKKNHIFLFNFVKFYKFSEYVVVDRSIGLVHMYSRKGVTPGRFVYIRQKNLENLYRDYRFKKVRNYKKYKDFGGGFPFVEKHLDRMGITIEGKPNCTVEDYETLKDKAIMGIGKSKDKTNPYNKKLKELKKMVGGIDCPIHTKEDLAEALGVTRATLHNWTKISFPNDDNSDMNVSNVKEYRHIIINGEGEGGEA